MSVTSKLASILTLLTVLSISVPECHAQNAGETTKKADQTPGGASLSVMGGCFLGGFLLSLLGFTALTSGATQEQRKVASRFRRPKDSIKKFIYPGEFQGIVAGAVTFAVIGTFVAFAILAMMVGNPSSQQSVITALPIYLSIPCFLGGVEAAYVLSMLVFFCEDYFCDSEK